MNVAVEKQSAKSPEQMTDAVTAARELFWRQGFEETSVAQLVDATGFNRYTLYNTFGGKLEIFLAVLDHYHDERKQIFMQAMVDSEYKPFDALRTVGTHCITQMVMRNAGCLVCNVAAEIGAAEPKIAAKVGEYLSEMEMTIEQAFTMASERGDLNPYLTPRECTELKMAHILGCGVKASRGASSDELLRTMNNFLVILSSQTS